MEGTCVPTWARGEPLAHREAPTGRFRVRARVLGGRPVVGHMPLEHGTLVRIQASQPYSGSGESKGRREWLIEFITR